MRKGRFPTWLAFLLAAGALVALIVLPSGGDDDNSERTTTTAAAAIPASEHAPIANVLAAVGGGEPLPYRRDGDVFENREGELPAMPRGYYREYTVPTPGSEDRGARRLVIGADGDVWYTADHYRSFQQLDPEDYK